MTKLIIAIGLIISIIISYLSWNLSRKINYGLSYKSMVEQTVIDLVKKEALK